MLPRAYARGPFAYAALCFTQVPSASFRAWGFDKSTFRELSRTAKTHFFQPAHDYAFEEEASEPESSELELSPELSLLLLSSSDSCSLSCSLALSLSLLSFLSLSGRNVSETISL